MNFPDHLHYTSEHEWVKIEGNIAIVGITDFAQDALGDVVYVDITGNKSYSQNDVFGTVEAVKTVSDLFMPVSGKIIEVNPDLTNSPDLVNSDPYGKGWMIKVEMTDSSEVSSLLSADKYQETL